VQPGPQLLVERSPSSKSISSAETALSSWLRLGRMDVFIALGRYWLETKTALGKSFAYVWSKVSEVVKNRFRG
jgi:hypothetical protein